MKQRNSKPANSRAKALRQSLTRVCWRLCLRFGTQWYRLGQLNKLAITAMQHLEIDATATMVATNDATGRHGLALVIDWHLQLPPAEHQALQIYVRRKIEEISGLDLHRGPFDVFVRDFATCMPGEIANSTSHWLRERIARLSVRSKDIQGRRPEQAPAADPVSGTCLEQATLPGEPVPSAAHEKSPACSTKPNESDLPAAQQWRYADRWGHRMHAPAAPVPTGLLERIDVGEYMTEYGALRDVPFPGAVEAQPTQPMVFDDEIGSQRGEGSHLRLQDPA